MQSGEKPKVRTKDQLGSVAQRVFDGRKSFANTSVVGDASAIEWNIEIHAHENALIGELQITNRELCHLRAP